MPHQLSQKEIFKKGRFLIKDVELQLDDPSGKNADAPDKLTNPQAPSTATFQIWEKADTVMIVPLTTDGQIIFINEYQTALDQVMLSLPKGFIEKGELSLETANKELQEEIGYKAHKLNHIATFTAFPGYISGKTHVYLARDLIESKLQGDEQWSLEIETYPFNNFEQLITDKKLTEARMIAALYEAKRFLNSGSLQSF